MKLVIAEKPSVANSIADVLGANDREDGYREGNGYIVSWCVGHLVELVTPDYYDEKYAKWNYESLPIIPDEFSYQVKDGVKKQFKILKDLMNRSDVDGLIEATDAGREGELIFRLVVKMCGCKKPIERLWISSMEESAIRDGFNHLRPGSEYENLYASALSRQQADWLVGINGTRLFTVLYNGKVLKVGRVQTPTLNMIVERESEIANFKPVPYYNVSLDLGGCTAISDKMDGKDDAENLATRCMGKEAYVSKVKREEKQIALPHLYDLTSLQRDANRIFGFTAKVTLEATQSLYEKKLVTYPRTDSQYLSDDMREYAGNVYWVIKEALPHLSLDTADMPNVDVVLNSKKVTDHHAIIPTMELGKLKDVTLSEKEEKVLNLIAHRLLVATSKKHRYESVVAEVICEDTVFKITNKVVIDDGFRAYEEAFRNHYKVAKEKEDEEMAGSIIFDEGQSVDVKCATSKESFTKPQKHFTEDSLLLAMEKAGASEMEAEVERKGLGTPATRADIIEKLVSDGFLVREKKKLLPTDDGVKLITILPDVVKSPKLTADWENELILVSEGSEPMDEFMGGIKKMVEDLVATYKEVSNKDMFKKEATILGKCPKCGADVLSGKFGAYCKDKCGMNLSKALGVALSDKQVTDMLSGKKVLVKGLTGKKGKYDAYLKTKGIKPYSYKAKDGSEKQGFNFEYEMTFPERKGSK